MAEGRSRLSGGPARLLRIAYRELWECRLPHGLLGWAYLRPGLAGRLRLHRRLWWSSGARWPRAAWLLVQVWLWLRWVFVLAWLDGARSVARHGADAARLWGVSRPRQLFRVLRLGLGWCVPPAHCYEFGLVCEPGRWLDYVYDHELAAYHQWRSAPLAPSAASNVLLQDKLALAAALAQLAIPVVRTRDSVARTDPPQGLATRLLGAERVFCKTRSGHAGIGAFTVWRTEAGLAGRCLDGRALPDSDAVEAAWRRLRNLDDALIQPCLTNHPALAPLAVGDDAITVRYISEWRGGQPACLSAVLEVPAGPHPRTGRTRYCILPLAAADGRLGPWPPRAYLPAQMRGIGANMLALVPTGFRAPGWGEVVRWSHQAQALFPDRWAIAWDWVLTPSGPVLLEGNPGWGTAIPQMLNGGLLDGRRGRKALPF